MKKQLIISLFGFFFLCGNVVYGDAADKRRINFCYEGFGSQYIPHEDEMENLELFISRHGKPLKTMEIDVVTEIVEDIEKRIILEYDTVMVKYIKYRRWYKSDYEVLLYSIESKEGITYLHGIRHGLTKNELVKTLGNIEMRGNVGYTYRPMTDTRVRFTFLDEKIVLIEWLFNVQ